MAVLSITWLLDGLEGSLGGSLAGALKNPLTLGFSDAQLGLSSSLYLVGAVLGAVVFGRLADRVGRRKLFFTTLLIYVVATAATGLSWNLTSFTLFRVFTGAGIGGEYSAVNSAVDELVPARLRGRISLWINGSFWLGIILGSVVASEFLSPSLFGLERGWRIAFLSGVPLGVLVLLLRRSIPESPRWLLLHGLSTEAETVMDTIEAAVHRQFGVLKASPGSAGVLVTPNSSWRQILRVAWGAYRRRTLICLSLMIAQAFFYNSVFFSLSLVLMRYYDVPGERIGLSFIPIAIANCLGPILLGRFFDTVGRRGMIPITYCGSGLLLSAGSYLFYIRYLTVRGQIGWWVVMFFFASAAASSAYLTISEVFPQQIRATAIGSFYAVGTLVGGVGAPFIFGKLTGRRDLLMAGYGLGAIMMIGAGIAQAIWGVAAEHKSLEELNP